MQQNIVSKYKYIIEEEEEQTNNEMGRQTATRKHKTLFSKY